MPSTTKLCAGGFSLGRESLLFVLSLLLALAALLELALACELVHRLPVLGSSHSSSQFDYVLGTP